MSKTRKGKKLSEWSLESLLETLHDDIHQQLEIVRKTLKHPVSKGDASENVWLELLRKYLPLRYRAEKAFVVDSKGTFSEQIDIVIFDRQYTPFIFNYKGQLIVPAEAVYAVFECKQKINTVFVKYAIEKAESVRRLHQTSLSIPHAGGTYPPKPPLKILAGILTFESGWKPPLGKALDEELLRHPGSLNLGCVAAHGYFHYSEDDKKYQNVQGGKPATSFLFKLISELQLSGTVPMIDVMEYSKWLSKTSVTSKM